LDREYQNRTLPTTDGLTLSFREYGSRFSEATPVLCLPGLTRNSADFHAIASVIASERRVISLDARGRGRSDYDPNYQNYNLVTEVGDVLSLISAEFERPCMILGTSRGGLAAMVLCGVRPSMVAGVVLNDIGPVLEAEGLDRIKDYLGIPPVPLETWEDAAAAIEAGNAEDFPDYDLKLRDAVLENTGPVPEMWPQFRAMADIPTLVLRGENSNLLSAKTVEEMRRAKPDLTAVTVKGRGHVPLLDEQESLTAINAFLERIDSKVQAA